MEGKSPRIWRLSINTSLQQAAVCRVAQTYPIKTCQKQQLIKAVPNKRQGATSYEANARLCMIFFFDISFTISLKRMRIYHESQP